MSELPRCYGTFLVPGDRLARAGYRLASHPYIHTPTPEQRTELNRLHNAAAEADARLDAAKSSIAVAQRAWESKIAQIETRRMSERLTNGKIDKAAVPRLSVGSPGNTAERVNRRLKFQYAETPLELDGKTTIEKSNKPIALCAGNKRWTISFWFRPDSNKSGAIFSSVEEPERYRPGIQADWIGNKIRVRHVCRWVNSYIEFESVRKLEVGQWHHVTFRCDGRMQGLAYSASLAGDDKAMACTHPVTNDSAEKAGKAPLRIGNSPLMPGFFGGLHDLRFYDRELTAGEVRSLADRRSTSEIACIPADSRTPSELETLRLAFMENEELPTELRELRDAQLESHAKLDEAIRDTPTTMVMKEGVTEHTRVRLAGVFDSPGDKVETDTPDFLPPLPEGPRNRLILARWLTHPDHPLTARVAVNRIWQTLWGRGFVDSPENFGTQTGEPLHADLLDWLATEYVRLGWDTKALIKLIVTSRTYRQRSDASEEMWQSDPENRHLARGPRFRLPVHTVRDQALFLSGRLDKTIGGPPVIIDEVIGQNGKIIKLPYENSGRRRTLYTYWKRNSPHPMLVVFDVADRNQCEVRTMRTNTPLQALVTLNEPGFAASAKALAERARNAPQTKSGQLRWLWQACTGRIPNDQKLKKLQEIHEDYLKLSDGDESQAWTAFCNVLLNLDASLTLE